jgi:protease-4
MKQGLWVTGGIVLSLVALVFAGLLGGAIGFLAGAAAGAAASGLAAPVERPISGEGPNKIAVIRIVGPISREGAGLSVLAAGAASRVIVQWLDRAMRDDAVKAVILELDTPGGSVVASDEVHQKLTALRGARKHVVALMTETAASGGYYIATAAERIIADPTTVTGSIGVIVALPNVEDLSRKIGIRTIVFKSGAFKDLGNPNRAVTPPEAAIFQRLVDEAYARFVDVVAQGRKMDRARVLALADGRIYTGRQAMQAGLVDAMGHLPEAIDAAMKLAGLTQARVVEYGGEGVLRSLLGGAADRLRGWLWSPAGPYPVWREPFSLQYLML